MKYVIVKSEFGKTPIIFTGILHNEFKKLGLPIVSAGFVKITKDKSNNHITCVCSGSSHSLDMKPGPLDDKLIEAHITVQ